jgi:hypothetical protein
LHQQEPSDDGRDEFHAAGPPAHASQQMHQQGVANAHLRTPPPSAAQHGRHVAVIQDTSSEYSPSTPQRNAVVGTGGGTPGTPVQASEVEHLKHTGSAFICSMQFFR